jgi:hypothetical protein
MQRKTILIYKLGILMIIWLINIIIYCSVSNIELDLHSNSSQILNIHLWDLKMRNAA